MESVRHDVNCLQDPRIDTRWKALQRVEQYYTGLSTPDAQKVYANELMKPLLKMFDDKRDRHREKAVQLVREMVSHQPYECMEWVLPVVVARLASEPAAEQAEPVRLEAMKLLCTCLETFPHDIFPRGFLDYFAAVIKACIKDGDPDMKLESCRCIRLLCTACREKTKAVALDLAKAVKPNLRVKQWKVRKACIEAFGNLICNGALDIIYDYRDEPNDTLTTRSFIKALVCDRSESVRQSTLEVISDWTMEITERTEMHRHFVPLVLLAMTDEIASVREKARQILLGLAAFFEMDNEDNRIDLDSRRVTLKDIKWYGDDTYPDMTFELPSKLPGTTFTDRPPIGARSVVAECCRTVIPNLLSDIVALEWAIPNSTVNRRMAAIRTLIVMLWFVESNALQFLQEILDALYKVLRDDDADVRREAFFCLQVIGKFHTPDNYIPLILSRNTEGEMSVKDHQQNPDDLEHRELRKRTLTVFSTTANTTRVNILIAFKYLLLGTVVLTADQALIITQAVTSADIADTEAPEQLLALLDLIMVLHNLLLKFEHVKPYESLEPPTEEAKDKVNAPLDFYIFFTLLEIQTCVDVRVIARSEEVLDKMSADLTQDPKGLYVRHFARAISDINNVPLSVLSKLLAHGGPMLRRHTESIVRVFVAHLRNVRYDVDVRSQLKCMMVLQDFILDVSATGVSFALAQLEDIIRVVIVPHGRWHVGGAAHLFRKVALGCLSALLVQKLLPPELWGPANGEADTDDERRAAERGRELLSSVFDTWKNSLDADDSELRAIVVKMSPYVIQLPILTTEAEDGMKELMLRFDDSNDIVRIQAAHAVESVFAILSKAALPAPVAKAFSDEKASGWVSTLLLHMDDANVELKETVCDCLVQVKQTHPAVVVKHAQQVRSKHMTTRLVDKLLES
ncbi:dynein assembly factor 5 [Diplonema papillatum]|nr:dynein assembly factor 5 [Diplonema papillatum]